MLHGLGESRSDTTNAVGMSINTIAETQLVPQGYAVLTFDARGTEKLPEKEASTIMGEREVRSDAPAMRKLDVRVQELALSLR